MPEIIVRKRNRAWRYVFSYPAGVLLFYPAAIVLISLFYTGAVPLESDGVPPSKTLPSLWLTALILSPVIVPFLMHMKREEGLDPVKVLFGAAKVLGFTTVAVLTTLLYDRSIGMIRAAVMFHVFLAGFQVLLIGLFVFFRGIGASGSFSQAATTIAGYLMIFSVVFANPALEYVDDAHRGLVIAGAVWSNPLVVASQSFLDLDVFRMQPLYGFSRLADFPFHYPHWKTVLAAYAALGGALAGSGALCRLLFSVLPKSLRKKRQAAAAELRRLENEAKIAAKGLEPQPIPVFPQSDFENEPSPQSGGAAEEQPLAMSFDDEAPHEQVDGMALGALQIEPEAGGPEPAGQGWTNEQGAPPAARAQEAPKPAASWLDSMGSRGSMKTRVFERDGAEDEAPGRPQGIPEPATPGEAAMPEEAGQTGAAPSSDSSIANLMAAFDDIDTRTVRPRPAESGFTGDSGGETQAEQPFGLSGEAQPSSAAGTGRDTPDSEEPEPDTSGETSPAPEPGFQPRPSPDDLPSPERQTRSSGPHVLNLWGDSPGGKAAAAAPGSMEEPFKGFLDSDEQQEETTADTGTSPEDGAAVQQIEPPVPEQEEEAAVEVEAEIEPEALPGHEAASLPEGPVTSPALSNGFVNEAPAEAAESPTRDATPPKRSTGLGWLDEAAGKREPAPPTEYERKDTVRMQRRSTSIFSEMRARLESKKTGMRPKGSEPPDENPPKSRFLKLDSGDESEADGNEAGN